MISKSIHHANTLPNKELHLRRFTHVHDVDEEYSVNSEGPPHHCVGSPGQSIIFAIGQVVACGLEAELMLLPL